MAVFLNNAIDAVDRNYLVTKSISAQAKAGTLIHVMDCSQGRSGAVSVDYRITDTGQDFHIDFPDLPHFCNWIRSDAFITRHYDKLDRKDILKYLNVKKSTACICLICFAILAFAIWEIVLHKMTGTTMVVVGSLLTLLAIVIVLFINKMRRKRVVDSLYKKVFKKWNVILK